MKKVLVTGGRGYIGGHLVMALLERGWEVATLDTGYSSKEWGFPKPTHALTGSVCNLDAVRRALNGVSLVYHLAARMDHDNNVRHPIRIFHTNVTGTVTLLSAAHEAGVDNVIFASSAAVYGNVAGAEEYGPKLPVNLYGCSKLAAEQVCQHFQNIGMNIKVMRLFNVWGGRYSRSVVGKFASGLKKIYGDGTQTSDFVYIDDVVQALLNAQVWDPDVYNIGTGVETAIGGLFDKFGTGEPEYNGAGPGYEEVYKSFADMELTFERVEWRPEVLLHELDVEKVRELCR